MGVGPSAVNSPHLPCLATPPPTVTLRHTGVSPPPCTHQLWGPGSPPSACPPSPPAWVLPCQTWTESSRPPTAPPWTESSPAWPRPPSAPPSTPPAPPPPPPTRLRTTPPSPAPPTVARPRERLTRTRPTGAQGPETPACPTPPTPPTALPSLLRDRTRTPCQPSLTTYRQAGQWQDGDNSNRNSNTCMKILMFCMK